MRTTLAFLIVSFTAITTAAAEQPRSVESPASRERSVDPADELEYHFNGGMEITGADGVVAAGARGRFLIGKAFGSGSVRPSLAIGAVFGAGSLHVDDSRALDGSLAIGYRSYGPEAQIALRFVDGGRIDSRIFGSFALLKVDLDERLMYDAVPNVGGNAGLRASLGINWADHAGSTVIVDDKHQAAVNLAVVMFPQQIELVWERDAGSNRYGVMFAWGI